MNEIDSQLTMLAGKPGRIFLPRIKIQIQLDCGGICAFPGCNRRVDPNDMTEDKIADGIEAGDCAHIYPKSTRMIRFDPTVNPKFIRSRKNGILLCVTHHRLIDNKKNMDKYTAVVLIEIRRAHVVRIAEKECAESKSTKKLKVNVYTCHGSGSFAKMILLPSGKCKVLVGSILLRDDERYSTRGSTRYLEAPYLARRRLETSDKIKVRDDGRKELLEDHEFESPTAAGEFIIGKPVNGYIVWKDSRGISLGDIIRESLVFP